MERTSRRYGSIERFIWIDERFRALSDDARFMFVYLLSTPLASICPGLIPASDVIIGESMGWVDMNDLETISASILRVRKAFKELAQPIGENKPSWVEYDPAARVTLIPRSVNHDPPRTEKQIKGWFRVLREIPKTPLKKTWLVNARNVVAKLYGHDDKRTIAFDTLRRSVCRLGDEATEPSANAFQLVEEQFQISRHEGEKSSGSKSEKSCSKSEKSCNKSEKSCNKSSDDCDTTGAKSFGEEPPETIEDFTCDSNSDSNTNSKLTRAFHEQEQEQEQEHIKEEQGAGNRASRSTRPASSNLKFVVEGKPDDPPEGFNNRQREMWDALRVATYYVPGHGEMTAWQAVPDPIRLAAELGGAAYPGVDAGLIHRLGNWTLENHSRAKKEIARFLVNRFGNTQERGRAAPQNGGAQYSGKNQVDLDERVARMNKGG